MSVDFIITTNSAEFENHQGLKINYSNGVLRDNNFTIGTHGLLFENDINEQVIQCFEVNSYKAFFKTEHADFPFDVLAASFYLLSRYEEYLPHKKDVYGRYAHEESLAFKENFLHLPLINIWVRHLIETLQCKYPAFTVPGSSFTFLPTYDIDIAYSYKHKGLLRNTGGFSKSPSLKRFKVLTGLARDPFDTYVFLDEIHGRYNLKPIYFFLVAEKNGTYDKNILPHKTAMQDLIKRHGKKYDIGLHPSWQSGDQPALTIREKEQLELISKKSITCSRQHYIRFDLPGKYRHLIKAGITNDYSMGYGSINGFRASVALPFNWYDLQTNEATGLLIHPFCFMEANSFYEQHNTPFQAYEELLHYSTICKKINGQMITIWHNNFFGSDRKFSGWREIYEQFLDHLYS